MAAEIINLRKARKTKARSEAEARAAENRVRFGRTKAQRQASDADDALHARRLEGHRLADPAKPAETDDKGGSA